MVENHWYREFEVLRYCALVSDKFLFSKYLHNAMYDAFKITESQSTGVKPLAGIELVTLAK